MPGDAYATHPTGLQIRFVEKDHAYTDANGQHYESVTTFIKRFFKPFDEDGEILRRKAAEANLTPEQLQAQWRAKGAAACDYGTRCHETAESKLLRGVQIHQPRDEKERTAFACVASTVEWLLSRFRFIATEQIVFSPAYALAGSIDLLMADDANRVLWVLDWKTNAEIPKVNNWNQKALAPIQHLDDCAFAKYALQLATYQRIIEHDGYLRASGLDGYKINRALIHIPPNATNAEWLPTPDLGREVVEMILAKFTDLLPF